MTTTVAVVILALTSILTTPSGQKFDTGRGIYVTLAMIGCLYLGFVASHSPGTAGALGFRLAPKQGWLFWFWAGAALSMGQFVLDFVVVRFVPAISLGRPEAITWQRFLSDCLMAPMAEETLFRMLTCPPAVALMGRWSAIVISGVIFASAHSVAGVASPANLIGGFSLAWLFLKSETILVPIVLHSVSNLAVMICLALAAPVVPAVPPDKQHAAEVMGIKSASNDIETTIKFVNNSNETIKVYWLNQQGQREPAGTVKSGQFYENRRTGPTHAWLITDVNDKAWYVYFADAQPRTVEIVAPAK